MMPGRELDAFVAEKVMGWKKSELTSSGYFYYPPEAVDPRSAGQRLESIPNYSTNISDAWLVVEKNPILFTLKYDYISGMWSAEFKRGLEVECDEAPHAICLAALNAVGVEI